MQKLYEIAIEPRLDDTEILYFRREDECISYDTFFNMIPYKKLKKYTLVKKLYFSDKVDLYNENGFIKSGNEVDLNEISDGSDILYLKSKGSNPQKIQISADVKPQRVSICIVICTYKRVAQVTENVRYLLDTMDERCHIILIDNASEIDEDYFSDDRVTIYHNRNTGGSGGFGKGMEKAVAMNCFTHIILMDDDATVDSTAIMKAAGFLSVLKPEFTDLCIAGSTVILQRPTIQFESGGFFSKDGIQTGYGYRYDLGEFEKLVDNEKEKKINYGGWWFFAMPIIYAKSGNLPAPFFMKYDDVEYALRCDLKIITLNGVGVWHDDFSIKYNSVQEYFNSRNYLFLMKEYSTDFNPRKAYRTARKLLLEKLCRQQYQMALLVIDAYTDFLKGRQNLEKIDYEKKLKELSQYNYIFYNDRELKEKYAIEYDSSKICRKPFRWYMQPLLYGHLIPDFLCPGLTVTDVYSDRKEHYFRASKVLHYDSFRHCGYVTEKSIIKFINCLRQLRIQYKRSRKNESI